MKPTMHRTPSSSFVEAIGYVPTPKAKRIAGTTGFVLVKIRGRVTAFAVPQIKWAQFMAARARGRVGSYFNKQIKTGPSITWEHAS